VKPGSTKPKVLLSTVYQRFKGDVEDPLGAVAKGIPRFSMRRDFSPGLRFIKQNVPEVEIMEYPRWREYVAKLKEGWDVVGFSFYQTEIDEIEKMAEEARRQGVGETWAGNYGALDARVPQVVDRVVVGPGENEIAQVFGYNVPEGDVEVPPMIARIRTIPGNITNFAFGLLFTQRGCPFKCTFCQTPAFDKKRFHFNVESIDRVLGYYKLAGVNYVFVGDEFFGGRAEDADRVTGLLARYKFRWYCQSRAATVLRHLDEWYERGLRFVHIGLESMNQEALDVVAKKQTVEEVSAFIRASGEKSGLLRLAAYMTGFPHMTAEDTVRDVLVLQRAGFDIHTVSIVTPFPQTPLWYEIDGKYGIFERASRRFDCKHLVWRHPYITPSEMEQLFKTVVRILNRPTVSYYSNLFRIFRGGRGAGGSKALWRGLVEDPVVSTPVGRKKAFFFPKTGRGGGAP
jgi:radical SAM superfamily enzyme YgiQ (UPF0313 family)